MGGPRKSHKTYDSPTKHWDKSRIDEEALIHTAFGLKNKKEIWKARKKLRGFREAARKLFTKTGPQAEKLKNELLTRLHRLGLLAQGASLDDVLGLNLENYVDRRLQTMIYKKGFAGTAKQARQLITHGHITVNHKIITIPGYIITRTEEEHISYAPTSSFASSDHPMRKMPKKDLETIERLRVARAERQAEEERGGRRDGR